LKQAPRCKCTDFPAVTFGWNSKLRKTDDFSSVFRFRCKQRGGLLDLYACPNNLGFPRLGLVVPKRHLARAVDRNRVKRIVRETFRLLQAELDGLDVVICLRGANLASNGEYRQVCERLLRQAKRCTQQPNKPIDE
jgi:ribonuclease P protein component